MSNLPLPAPALVAPGKPGTHGARDGRGIHHFFVLPDSDPVPRGRAGHPIHLLRRTARRTNSSLVAPGNPGTHGARDGRGIHHFFVLPDSDPVPRGRAGHPIHLLRRTARRTTSSLVVPGTPGTYGARDGRGIHHFFVLPDSDPVPRGRAGHPIHLLRRTARRTTSSLVVPGTPGTYRARAGCSRRQRSGKSTPSPPTLPTIRHCEYRPYVVPSALMFSRAKPRDLRRSPTSTAMCRATPATMTAVVPGPIWYPGAPRNAQPAVTPIPTPCPIPSRV